MTKSELQAFFTEHFDLCIDVREQVDGLYLDHTPLGEPFSLCAMFVIYEGDLSETIQSHWGLDVQFTFRGTAKSELIDHAENWAIYLTASQFLATASQVVLRCEKDRKLYVASHGRPFTGQPEYFDAVLMVRVWQLE